MKVLQHHSRATTILASAALAAAALGLAASTATAAPVAQAAKVTTVHVGKTSLGNVLVTAKGMTIYAYAIDKKGKSNCTGSCATYWPPVSASQTPKKHIAGVTAKFGVLKRSNGFKQLTVNGYPAYTYGSDTPGKASGEAVGGVWWAVAPTGKWIKTTKIMLP